MSRLGGEGRLLRGIFPKRGSFRISGSPFGSLKGRGMSITKVGIPVKLRVLIKSYEGLYVQYLSQFFLMFTKKI